MTTSALMVAIYPSVTHSSHNPEFPDHDFRWLPNPDKMGTGPAVWLEVARRGHGNSLDAPITWSKLYFRKGSVGRIRLHSPSDQCGPPPDSNFQAPTRFEFFKATASEGVGARVGVDTDPATCGFKDYAFGGLARSTIPGHTNYYVMYVKATHLGSSGGVNAFKVEAFEHDFSAGVAGYWDQGVNAFQPGRPSQREFAIQDRENGNNTFTHMRFEFAPGCNQLDEGQSRRAYLRWFDADQGTGNQTRTISFDLYERFPDGRPDRKIISNFTNVGGDNEYRETSFIARGDHKYIWIWNNVQKINGLQLWMAFDSFNFNITCERQKLGSITVQKTNIDTGQRINEGIRTRIDGVQDWTTSSRYTRRVSVPANYTARAETSRDEWVLAEVCVSGQRCYSPRSSVSVNMPNQSGASKTVTWKYRQRTWDLNVDLIPINFTHDGNIESDITYSMRATVRNNGPKAELSTPRDITLEVTSDRESALKNKNPNPWRWTNIGPIGVNRSVSRDMSFQIRNSTAHHNRRICFTARAFADQRSGGTATDTVCARILIPREPYLTTAGGDIHAGYEYGSEPCLLPTDRLARIRGNVHSGFGSKADFVVSAGGRIRQFGSAGEPGGNKLTLGNNAGDGFYGQVCRPDKFDQLWEHSDRVLATSPNQIRNLLTTGGPGNIIVNYDGNLTLSGPLQIPRGRHVTLVVNGSVYITRTGSGSGITLHGGPYTERNRQPAIQDVPSFALVTRNHIRIDNRITRLDGIYYAGTNTSTGRIDTCGNSATGGGPSITGNGQAANCANRLTVRGALVADQIRFRRTIGDVKVDKDDAAEKVLFLAQLYLQPPPGFNLLVAQLLYNGERPPAF